MNTFSRYIAEANFSKTMKILRGDVPHVATLAIMTANNPMNMALSQSKNRELNKKLKNDLKNFNYNPVRLSGGLKGKFGLKKLEDSFLIPHMSLRSALDFGKKYNQQAIIWGEKKHHAERGNYIQFDFYDRDHADQDFRKVQSRNVAISGEHARTKDDMFSGTKMRSYNKDKSLRDEAKKKGITDVEAGLPPASNWGETPNTQKVVIPFFNDDYENAMYSKDRRGIDKIGSLDTTIDAQPLAKAEFYIPFFDDVIAGEIPICDLDKDVTFCESELPNKSSVKSIIGRIHAKEIALYSGEEYTEKNRWQARGGINVLIDELKSII